MKQFEATLAWQRGDQAFTDQRYSRAHRWRFDGGLDVVSGSILATYPPTIVPTPLPTWWPSYSSGTIVTPSP